MAYLNNALTCSLNSNKDAAVKDFYPFSKSLMISKASSIADNV
jgi:hypothetical protein